MERCQSCGFDTEELPRDEIAGALRMIARQYDSRLRAVGSRTAADPLTPIEHALAVASSLRGRREQIALILAFHEPILDAQPRTVTEQQRASLHADKASKSLLTAADALASLLESLDPGEWERIGHLGRARTILWLGRDAVHLLAHHLLALSSALQPSPGPASGC